MYIHRSTCTCHMSWYYTCTLSRVQGYVMCVYTLIHMYIYISRGVPAVVDFAAMRDGVKKLGGDPAKINPVCPADLVIDHSVQVIDTCVCICVCVCVYLSVCLCLCVSVCVCVCV